MMHAPKSKHIVFTTVALVGMLKSVAGFATQITQQTQSRSLQSLSMTPVHQDEQQNSGLKRNAMFGAASLLAAATVFLSPFNTVSLALEDDVATSTVEATSVSPEPVTVVETPQSVSPEPVTVIATPKYSIAQCSFGSKKPVCISTSNVRQLDLYTPPWTFAMNADKAMARLKGAVEGEPLNTIVSSEDNTSRHLIVDSKRSKLGTTAYRMEFIINESDGVITFRSSAPPDITGPDFGLQRKRLSEIRERAGSFGVMGEALDSADTKSSGERGNGPLGQLKSFYGLQSGAGFEDVLSQ